MTDLALPKKDSDAPVKLGPNGSALCDICGGPAQAYVYGYWVCEGHHLAVEVAIMGTNESRGLAPDGTGIAERGQTL